MNTPWQNRDQKVLWHPFSPVRGEGAFKPVKVDHAEGAYFFLEDGRKIFDGISSWWVNLHGHGHPYLQQMVEKQFSRLDHVMFAGFTHEGAIVFAERLLAKLAPVYEKVFYSDNGSTAVEVALKMAMQRENLTGKKRKKILAFHGAYHGDTFGAMSLGERGTFNEHFHPYLFDVTFITPPTPGNHEKTLKEFAAATARDEVAAFIFEPLLQGSAGMIMHDAHCLQQMLQACRQKNITTIADEVMTGFFRTGTFRATEKVGFDPDLICFSKGITGGVFPLGVTVCHQELVEVFRPDQKQHLFFHGHSYTANPLALSMALGSLDLLDRASTLKQIELIVQRQEAGKHKLAGWIEAHQLQEKVSVRHLGTMLAFEIHQSEQNYLHPLRETLYAYFLERNVLLRPLGNIAYTLPPYCATLDEIDHIQELMLSFLQHHFL